jgi:hypothetical protein
MLRSNIGERECRDAYASVARVSLLRVRARGEGAYKKTRISYLR